MDTFETIFSHTLSYHELVNIYFRLKENKTNREVAIVITELEKVIAYYKMFVLDKVTDASY